MKNDLLLKIKSVFVADALKFKRDSKDRVVFPNPNSKDGMARAKSLLKKKLSKEEFKTLVFTDSVVCKIILN